MPIFTQMRTMLSLVHNLILVKLITSDFRSCQVLIGSNIHQQYPILYPIKLDTFKLLPRISHLIPWKRYIMVKTRKKLFKQSQYDKTKKTPCLFIYWSTMFIFFFFFFLKCWEVTYPSSSSTVPLWWSQTMTRVSYEAVANSAPSGENSQDTTSLWCPSSFRISVYLSMFHKNTCNVKGGWL